LLLGLFLFRREAAAKHGEESAFIFLLLFELRFLNRLLWSLLGHLL
jgi:hypothetical protein